LNISEGVPGMYVCYTIDDLLYVNAWHSDG
jgi:hypothetical protein